MLIAKTPLAVAAMLFAVGGLGVTSAAWAVSDSSQLPVMVVSATGYQQEALRAPASITVVEHDQIQRKPVSDLAEILRDIPGVDIVDSGVAGMKRISLRGESSRRVLIKVNGQPIPDHSSYGSPLLLDANIIERIEVVRGSASVVHGSNAIGGVVNITTRQAAPGEQEAFVGAGYYSATRGQRLNGGVLGATERFDWRLQLSKADFGDRRIPRGQVKGSTDQTKYSRLKDTDYEQESVSAEAGWHLDERQRIAWQGDYFKQDAKIWSDKPNVKVVFPKRDSLRNALTYSFVDEEALFHNIDGRVYQQKGKRIMDNEAFELGQFTPKPFMVGGSTRSVDKLDTKGLQLSAAGDFWGEHTTVIGFEYQQDKLDTKKNGYTITPLFVPPPPFPPSFKPVTKPTSTAQKSEQKFWSAFAQQQIRFTDNLEANLGARYYDINSKLERSTERNAASKSDGQVVGSTSLVWQYSDSSVVRANVAQGYTYPSLVQQFSISKGGSATNYGNPELKAETATTYELGWRMEDNGLTADATLYHSRARDFIDKVDFGTESPPVPCTTSKCYKWVNVSKAQTTGVELMLAYQLENWRPYMNMGVQKRRLDFGIGNKTWKSGLPQFQGRIGTEWYASEQLELDLYVRGGGKSRKQDGNDLSGKTGEERTSSYAELNVGAYYKPVPNLSLAVLAQNLADRRYRNPDELQAAGRALDMEVRWSF